jgi:hypothetical protein
MSRKTEASYTVVAALAADDEIEIPVATTVAAENTAGQEVFAEGSSKEEGSVKWFDYDEHALHFYRIEKKYEPFLVLQVSCVFASFIWLMCVLDNNEAMKLPGVLLAVSIVNIVAQLFCDTWKVLMFRFVVPKPIPRTTINENGIRHVQPADDSGWRSVVGNKVYDPSPVGGTVFIPFEDVQEIEVSLEKCGGCAVTRVIITMSSSDESKFVERGFPSFGRTFTKNKNGIIISDEQNNDDTTCMMIRGLRDPYQFKKCVVAAKE